jgi:hypothetical protein
MAQGAVDTIMLDRLGPPAHGTEISSRLRRVVFYFKDGWKVCGTMNSCPFKTANTNSRSPFDFAQGRLSAPLRNAWLRMTAVRSGSCNPTLATETMAHRGTPNEVPRISCVGPAARLAMPFGKRLPLLRFHR